MITLCIKAHHIMWPRDTYERRIFRLELFGCLDCSLSLPLDIIGNFLRTNFSLTSCFMGLYIKEEMFVSSSSKFLIFLPDDLPIYNSSYVDIESQWQSYQI